MNFLKTFFIPITTLNLSASLALPSVVVKNNTSYSDDYEDKNLAVEINYHWEDTYKSSDSDSSADYVLMNWYKKTFNYYWEQFAGRYNNFSLTGRIGVGIKQEHSQVFQLYWEINSTHLIRKGFKNSLIISKSYFYSATRYTVVNLHIWRDSNNIYYKWKAFFKGDATNWIYINLQSIYFYWG